MSELATAWNPRGSEWNRWDPHIHTPGTINNDQFKGDWAGYIRALNQATPAIRVLGVTDYYSLDSYREMRRRKVAGELPQADLLFPNVEARLDMRADKQAINLHFLFSPDDPRHETEIERILSHFSFEFEGILYQCTRNGLIDLGRKRKPELVADNAALQEGTKQFKISYKDLRQLLRNDHWLRENCLIAVAAGQGDGTSGLQSDDAFAAAREEIQRLCHLIFSGKPSDRDYWLGRKPGDPRESLERKYGGLKPCLHGCDAHRLQDVGCPDQDRYCWLKGDLSFESLRQAAIDPEERVYIGPTPPASAAPSVTLDRILPKGTPWLQNADVQLNPGLVAVIGARGSGKTALVDLVAAAADALDRPLSESSFLKRAVSAANFGHGAVVAALWADGRPMERPLASPGEFDVPGEAEVCYLSQQFVERLCSSSGLALDLRKEIERVIFDQTDKEDRMETTDFAELSAVLLEPIRRRRLQQADTIRQHSAKIATEQKQMDLLSSLKTTLKTQKDTLTRQKEDLAKLIPKGKEGRAKKLGEFEAACTQAESKIETLRRRRLSLDGLLAETEHETTQAEPTRFTSLLETFADSALTDGEWAAFRQAYRGAVAAVVAKAKAAALREIQKIEQGDAENPIDLATAPLTDWPLTILKSKRDELKKEVGLDVDQQKKYDTLKKTIEAGDTALKKTDTALKSAEGAEGRRDELVTARREAYRDLIQTFVEEQDTLAKLYEPLHRQLDSAKGALGRLRLSVKRVIDPERWVQAGEELFDLRKTSRFQGRGSLALEAGKALVPAWRSGDADAVANALQSFVSENFKELLRAIPASYAGGNETEWRRRLGDWLFSSDHITIQYGLEYEGVAIERLSPGTRGIVLLLLFLAIDRHDRRPLLIDQPEENLDPKSIFDDLVPHFREARRRRQIIIVTHNANLVVNTDADQVIVASASPAQDGGLPVIGYTMGSLENPEIRRSVCAILEGGERAFLERERRYRLQWDQILDERPTLPAAAGSAKASSATAFYFAYGSNLSSVQMKLRCPDHRRMARATLVDHRWIISSRGVANIVPSKADTVEGFLFELSEDDVISLDRHEGVPGANYFKATIEVQCAGRTLSAMTYIDRVTTEGRPSSEYAARINAGLVDAGLPEAYVTTYIRKFIPAAQ